MKAKRIVQAVAAGAGLVLLAGCASAPASSSSPQAAAAGAPQAAAPLTGIYYDAASLAHSSLAAKIDNHEEARPQWGLNDTDVVYEELVEGGLTRYVAVWHSRVPAIIGPVRSIRPMDPDIVTPFLGIIAYSGGQAIFVDMMHKTPVYNAVHGQADTEAFMARDDSRDAPHNVAVKAPELIAAHSDLKAPQKMFTFSLDQQGMFSSWVGKPGTQVNVTFSGERYPAWTYDPTTKKYLRSQEGAPDFDSNKAQISATNVIVMSVQIDGQYGYVPKTVLVTSGTGIIATHGVYTEMKWSKKSADAPIVYTTVDGTPITLSPGNTWIEMPPTYGSFKVN